MGKSAISAILVANIVAAVAWLGPQSAQADPPADETAVLQGMFDRLQPGETLTLEPRTYLHSGALFIRVPGVQVDGNGATLTSTNDATSSLLIFADNVSLRNLKRTAPQQGPRYNEVGQHSLVVGANGVRLSDITIDGSASAGVFVGTSNNFRLERLTIRDTRADGIQMMGGASNGQVNDVTTERTGDDGIAVLSSRNVSAPTRDIVINSPVVRGSAQRGIVVDGGERVAVNNVTVSDTVAPGVYVGSQNVIVDSGPTSDVRITGGTITRGNTAGIPAGALTVLSQGGGHQVSNVTASDLTIIDTPPFAQQNIGIGTFDGGVLQNIALRNIAIQQRTDLRPIFTNAPPGSYVASGFTQNGTPVAV